MWRGVSIAAGVLVASAVILAAIMYASAAPAHASVGSSQADIVKVGKRYLYRPYDPPNMDCAGFTKKVFNHFGVYLPDSPGGQMYYGYRPPHKAKGDLLFFDEKHNGGTSHVGIYAGDGKILHSSKYFGKVVVSEMKYIRGYKGNRRIIVG